MARVLCSPARAVGLEDVHLAGAEVVVGRVVSCGKTLDCDALLLLEHVHEVLAGEVGAAVHLLVALEHLVLHRGQAPQGEGEVVGRACRAAAPAWKNSGTFWRAQSRPGNGEKKMPPSTSGQPAPSTALRPLLMPTPTYCGAVALRAGLLGELDVVDRRGEDEQHLDAGALASRWRRW